MSRAVYIKPPEDVISRIIHSAFGPDRSGSVRRVDEALARLGPLCYPAPSKQDVNSILSRFPVVYIEDSARGSGQTCGEMRNFRIHRNRVICDIVPGFVGFKVDRKSVDDFLGVVFRLACRSYLLQVSESDHTPPSNLHS